MKSSFTALDISAHFAVDCIVLVLCLFFLAALFLLLLTSAPYLIETFFQFLIKSIPYADEY